MIIFFLIFELVEFTSIVYQNIHNTILIINIIINTIIIIWLFWEFFTPT